MSETAVDEPRQIRPFADFIGEQQTLADQLSTTLNDLIEAVADTGKAGALQLTVKVKPVSKVNGQVLVSSEVVSKAPKPEPADRVYFITDEFNLSRSDPHQPSLPLREVPRSDEAPRTIPSAGGGRL
jgi:hypothetical protein